MTIPVKRRSDYKAPDFFIHHVTLDFVLDPVKTRVKSTLTVQRNSILNADLVLDGIGLTLISVKVNEFAYSQFTIETDALIIRDLPQAFKLEIVTEVSPSTNQSLEGLYLSNGAYCTQCEAEGFRKITYFLDRPDILSTYDVTITANKQDFPYLLSNGNKTRQIDIDEHTHQVSWSDPHKKPCYLFALVAGNFDLLTDSFITLSGKKVALELFVDRGNSHLGHHALASLKRAMKWDEDVYGLEYDLDIYMVVAVDFFNMGAMENKGLNVFNSKFVLADASSATDEDFFNIEAVIGHEYFHNWTGNRVTCRDWFQLSLKEGLTVFRDQMFSGDMVSHLSTRISQVKVMKEHQFAEDAGPMSHPIRPDEVMEMNNFYTVTVYDKGAEVIRMMHTLLGKDGFRKGMDLYFKRHDGQAVTCDDFVNAMQDAGNNDLSQFKHWYSQSGTPIINIVRSETNQDYIQFSLSQHHNKTADQSNKTDLVIPIAYQMIRRTKHSNSVSVSSSQLAVLQSSSLSISVEGGAEQVIPVWLENFSAPVIVNYNYSIDELVCIIEYASDDFARWDAAQRFYNYAISELEHGRSIEHLPWSEYQQAVKSCSTNLELLSEILSIPSFETLIQSRNEVNPPTLVAARSAFMSILTQKIAPMLQTFLSSIHNGEYEYSKRQVNQRRLRNAIILLLAQHQSDEVQSLITESYASADNMTDKLGALKAAQQYSIPIFDKLMTLFESQYNTQALIMDKWFALQATTDRNDLLTRILLLQDHQQFNVNNPNRVRSLIGSFAFYNPSHFHAVDGSGYKLLSDYLIKLDAINPQITSRLITPLTQWKKFDKDRQQLMRAQLGRLLNHKSLSKDVFEKVSKSLTI